MAMHSNRSTMSGRKVFELLDGSAIGQVSVWPNRVLLGPTLW